jgi:PAS domain S-box-containing protein
MKHLIQALAKASDGAFVINEQFRIVYWNEAAESILGFTAVQATGQYCYELLGGRDEKGRPFCQRFCRISLTTSRGRTPPNIDMYASATAGDGRWINVSTFALPVEDPKASNAIVHLFRNATRKKSSERFIDEIIEAYRKLQDQEKYASAPTPHTEPSSDANLSSLTPRERQVLLLLARGLSTIEISDSLAISPSTARNHIHSILTKLGVHSRLEAVAHAILNGGIEAPDGNE